jgi:phage protein D
MIDLLPGGAPATPGVRRPTFSVEVGRGGGAGDGLGGLASAASAALGIGGSEDPWRRSLASIRIAAGIAPTVDSLEILLSGDSQAPTVNVGDAATVSIGYEDAATVVVFTGTVDRVRRALDGTVLVGASNGGSSLARLRLNQSYENQAAGKVVRDLAGRVGLDTATVEDGVDLAFFVVDDRRTAYVQVAELARRCGFLAFVTHEGQLNFAPSPSGDPVATFHYAVDVLALDVTQGRPERGQVSIWGEGAAGSQGQEAWAWLVKDLGSVTGSAGSGEPELGFADSVLRSGDAAATAATSLSQAAAANQTRARLLVPGAAEVTAGSVIAVADAADAFNGNYLVHGVRHRFAKHGGFTTELRLVKASAGGGGLGALGGLS